MSCESTYSIGRRVFLRDNCVIEPRHRRYGNIARIPPGTDAKNIILPCNEFCNKNQGNIVRGLCALSLAAKDNDSPRRSLGRNAPGCNGVVDQKKISTRRAGKTLSVEGKDFRVAPKV